MPPEQNAVAALLLTISGGLVVAVVVHYMNHGLSRRQVPAVLLTIALLVLRWQWESVAVLMPNLAQSVATIASNGWVWFGLVSAVWLHSAVTSVIALRQRDKLAVVVENDIVPFRHVIQRFVLPRLLDDEQMAAIGKALESAPTFSGVLRVKVPPDDAEAAAFATVLRKAIQRGRWKTEMSEEAALNPGLSIHFASTQETGERYKLLHGEKKPNVLLRDALRSAGVDVTGMSESGAAAVDDLVLQVGKRPLDSYGKWPFRA